MRIGIGQTAAYCAANPVLAEALQRLDHKEAAALIQVSFSLGAVGHKPCTYLA
jgi:hypothetical protein